MFLGHKSFVDGKSTVAMTTHVSKFYNVGYDKMSLPSGVKVFED